MTIIYHDEIGLVAVTIDNPTEVAFFSGCIWFSDDAGKDYKIPFEQVSEIHNL